MLQRCSILAVQPGTLSSRCCRDNVLFYELGATVVTNHLKSEEERAQQARYFCFLF